MQSDAAETFEGKLFMSTQHVTRQKARKEEEIGEESDLAWYVPFPKRVLVGGPRETNLSSATGPINEKEPQSRDLDLATNPGGFFWTSMPFLSAVGIKFAAGQGAGKEGS